MKILLDGIVADILTDSQYYHHITIIFLSIILANIMFTVIYVRSRFELIEKTEHLMLSVGKNFRMLRIASLFPLAVITLLPSLLVVYLFWLPEKKLSNSEINYLLDNAPTQKATLIKKITFNKKDVQSVRLKEIQVNKEDGQD